MSQVSGVKKVLLLVFLFWGLFNCQVRWEASSFGAVLTVCEYDPFKNIKSNVSEVFNVVATVLEVVNGQEDPVLVARQVFYPEVQFERDYAGYVLAEWIVEQAICEGTKKMGFGIPVSILASMQSGYGVNQGSLLQKNISAPCACYSTLTGTPTNFLKGIASFHYDVLL